MNTKFKPNDRVYFIDGGAGDTGTVIGYENGYYAVAWDHNDPFDSDIHFEFTEDDLECLEG